MASLIKQTEAVLAKLIAKPDLAWSVGNALVNDKLIVGPWEREDKKFSRKTLKGATAGWVTVDGSYYTWYANRGSTVDSGRTPDLRNALDMVDAKLREDNRIVAASEVKLAGDWYSHHAAWERRDLVDNIVLAEIKRHYSYHPNPDGAGKHEVVFHECVGALCFVGGVEELKAYADEKLKKAGWTLTEEVGLG